MSWVSSKEAAELLHVNYDALVKAVKRAGLKDKKFCSVKGKNLHFQHIDGVGGAGGKVLQIWIGEADVFEQGTVDEVRGGVDALAPRADNVFNGDVVRDEPMGAYPSDCIAQPSISVKQRSDFKSKEAYKKEIVNFAVAYSVKKASEIYGENEKSIYRWVDRFTKEGAKALKDKRGANNKKANTSLIEEAIYAVGSAHATTWFEAYCLFYARKNGVPFDRFNLKADITFSTFFRNATKLKEENPSIRAFLKRGLDGLDVRPTAIRNYLKENDEWQIDATKIDFMALNDLGEAQRYTAIAITDTASKKRVWELFDSPNSYANVRLLKKALMKLGKPLVIKGDNGKDYVSSHFQGVLQRLGIAYWAAEPFKGYQKGVIERGFRSIQHALEILPGFIGHNAGERIEAESQAIEKAKRLSGAKTHLDGLLTRDELMAIIDEHIDNTYNKGWENMECDVDLRVLGKSKQLTLHAQGLKYNGFFYQNLAMYRNYEIGTKFELVEDIDDCSKAYVYTLDGEFVCEALDERVISLSAEEVKAAQKEYKKNFVSTKKAIAKDLRVLKNESYKSHAQSLLAKREQAYKEHKEAMFKKPKTNDEEVEITVKVKAGLGNKKEYRPSTDDMDDALRALKG